MLLVEQSNLHICTQRCAHLHLAPKPKAFTQIVTIAQSDLAECTAATNCHLDQGRSTGVRDAQAACTGGDQDVGISVRPRRRIRGALTFLVGGGNGQRTPSEKIAGLNSSGISSYIKGLFLYRSMCASRPCTGLHEISQVCLPQARHQFEKP